MSKKPKKGRPNKTMPKRVGPARHWYQGQVLHRDDGPAVEWDDGNKYWYCYGQPHREDGPATEAERRLWSKEGVLHRLDGPAVERPSDGGGLAGTHLFLWYAREVWYKEGLIHRVDGPAVVRMDGSKETWRRGTFIKSHA